MKQFCSVVALSAMLAGMAAPALAQWGSPAHGPSGSDDSVTCPANAVHSTGVAPTFSNVSVSNDLVFLNSRVASNGTAFFAPPEHKAFILTDIVVQNRAPGDEPVADTQSSRLSITAPNGADSFLTVVGNRTLSQHFTTGIFEPSLFRFFNVGSSSAPFVEVFITGVLRDCARR